MKEESINFISGTVAGFFQVLFNGPLDTLQTRFIMRQERVGLYSSTSSIIKSQGIRGLYRGASISFAVFPLSWGIYFAIYDRANHWIQGRNTTRFSDRFISSGIAGTITMLSTNPLWLLRARMQIQTTNKGTYTSITQGIKKIVKEEGFHTLWNGCSVAFLAVLHISIQMALYQKLKSIYSQSISFNNILFCSTTSKIAATLLTFPYQVFLTNIYVSQQRTYVMDVIKKVYKNKGLKGFYAGLVPNLWRSLLSSFIILYVHENVRNFLTFGENKIN